MAWTTPKNWGSEVLTSADMDTYLSDNDAYLKAQLDLIPQRIISISTTETTVTNTTTETNLFTVSVPANTLDSNDLIHIEGIVNVTSASGANNCTLRVQFGTTITLAFSAISVDSTTHMAKIDAWIKSNNSTSAQRAYGTQVEGATGSTPGTSHATDLAGTEDVTGAVTLSLTAQWAGASTNYTAYGLFWRVEHLSV